MNYQLDIFKWGVAAIAFIALPGSVNATVMSFDLEGNIAAPSTYQAAWWGSAKNTGNKFNVQINRGDLVLTYDDKNSASFADDVLKITGTTLGCHNGGGACDASKPAGWTKTHTWWTGQGEFEWDLTLSNPLTDASKPFHTEDMTDIVFGAQSVGSLTMLNAPRGVPAKIDVMAKEHPDLQYAFRLFQEDGNQYRISSWLLNQGGVIGGKSRFESLLGEAVFNSDLVAYKRETPTNEVPEPGSMLLLTSALFGGSRLRRKKSQK